MGIYEFLMLSNEEQWDVLWDKGVYLTSFKSIDCSYRLYAIDKFYVELEMCTIHASRALHKRQAQRLLLTLAEQKLV